MVEWLEVEEMILDITVPSRMVATEAEVGVKLMPEGGLKPWDGKLEKTREPVAGS